MTTKSTRLRPRSISSTAAIALALAVGSVSRIAAAPAAPVLSPAQITGSTVTLSWTVPLGTTGIRLEAGTAPGSTNAANVVLGALSGYTATSVPAGIYYVRVRAIDASGESAPSNEVTVSLGAGGSCASAPNPPTLAPAAVSGTLVQLTWAQGGGCPATSFTIYAGSGPGLSNLASVNAGAALGFSASAGAGTYYVRVVAANGAGASAPSNEITVTVGGGTGGPPPPTNGPIILTGTQSMVISGTLAFKNDIVLRDDAVLTIRNATFSHLSDFSGQYTLAAYDRARVVIENSTITSSPWINWRFEQDASLQMTNVTNRDSLIWHAFEDRARAVAVGVSRFTGTVSDSSSFIGDGAEFTFIETVYPRGGTVNEAYPHSIGNAGYAFPNTGEGGGVFPRITLRNVTSTAWGITYVPESSVTITDTDSLVVTFRIDERFSGLTAEFSNLGAKHYVDQTWTTGGASLRLVNTKTLPWSPLVSGNHNTLIVRDSELADFAMGSGYSNAFFYNSTLSFVRAQFGTRVTLTGCTVTGDVVAGENGVITLNGTRVLGQIVRLANGQIVNNP
jgi:hypothetical protein